MKDKIQKARNDGFSDDEIVEFLSESNKKVAAAKKDGFSSGEILSFLLDEGGEPEEPAAPTKEVKDRPFPSTPPTKEQIENQWTSRVLGGAANLVGRGDQFSSDISGVARTLTEEQQEDLAKRARILGGVQGLGEKLGEVDIPIPQTKALEIAGSIAEMGISPEATTRRAAEKAEGINKALEAESIPRIVAGLGTELSVSEGSKYAGAKAGARRGPIGAAAGYLIGALTGGATGSIAAQKVEGRENISWGRVIADSLLNLIPGSEVKRGPKLIQKATKKMADAPVTSGAVVGGLAGGGTNLAEQALDGDGIDLGETAKAAATTAGFGAGLGLTQRGFKKMFGRLARKSPEELDRLVAEGDPDAVGYLNFLLREEDTSALPQMDSTGFVGRLANRAKSKFLPSRRVGEKASEAMTSGIDSATAEKELGALMNKRITAAIDNADDPIAAQADAMDYLAGKTSTPPSSIAKDKQLVEDLSEARANIRRLQEKLLDQHNDGLIELDEPLKITIENSLNRGDYLNQSYRFFDDAGYNPSRKNYQAAVDELVGEGMDADTAKKYLSDLQINKAGAEGFDPDMIHSVSSDVLKKKEDIGPALRRYLGEYIDPGERVESTISKLGRLTAFNEADGVTARALSDAGLLRSSPPDDSWVKIKLRRGDASVDGEVMYGPKDVQNAINELYGLKLDGDAANAAARVFNDLWDTSASAFKAGKVVFNPASYAPNLWGNAMNMLGMGMNPAKNTRRNLQMVKAGMAPGSSRKNMRKSDVQHMNKAKKHGVLEPGMQYQEIKAGLEGGAVGKAVGKLYDPVGKLYSMTDSTMRLNAWDNYRGFLSKAAPDAAADSVDKVAARLTNDTFQNFGKLNKSLRYLSRKGVLPQFVSFTAETIRNQINQFGLAYKMLSGKFADELSEELGVEVSRKVVAREGIKRLAFLTGVYGAQIGGLTAYNRSTASADEENALRRSVIYDFAGKDPLAMKFDKENGKVEWANSSYIVPHAIMTAPVQAALRQDNPKEAFMAALGYMGNQFKGEGSFAFRAAAEAASNLDLTYGETITDDPDAIRGSSDRFMHFLKEGKWRVFDEYDKAKNEGLETAAKRLMGFRVTEQNIADGFRWHVRKSNDSTKSIAKKLSGARYRLQDGKISDEEFEAQYQDLNRQHKGHMETIAQHIDDMRTLGQDDEMIFSNLRETGVGSKKALYAYDGIIEDLPRIKAPSTEDKYNDLMERAGGNFGAATRMAKKEGGDGFDLKRLAEHHKKVIKRGLLDIKTKDDMIRALDTESGDRAEYIFAAMNNSPDPDAVYRDFAKKGLIRGEVAHQIELLKKAAK